VTACRYCGRAHLKWRLLPTGWRLFTRSGDMHSCSKHPSTRRAPAAEISRPPTTLERAMSEHRASFSDWVQPAMRGAWPKSLLDLDEIPAAPVSGPEFEFEDLP